MRNPNGYGSVYKLSGKRRNPWAARVTTGWNMIEEKKAAYPVYKFIGYFPTRAKALRALAQYHGEDISEKAKDRLLDVVSAWSEEKFPQLKFTRNYDAAIKVFSPLYDRKLAELTIKDYEDLFARSGKGYDSLRVCKIMLKAVYAYAYRKGIITESRANLPSFIEIGQKKKKTELHKAFSHKEIELLWKHKSDPDVQIILFMIYSGLRVSELANLKTADVDLEKRYFDIKEAKTASGIRRVPLANKIMFIASSWKAQNGVYFAPIGHTVKNIEKFRCERFVPICERILGNHHLPHDTRYTTATLLTEARIDDRYIKLILGHKSQDITNAVYAAKLDMKILIESIDGI